MDNAICEAISERRLITFRYDLERRSVEPHALGISAEGQKLLRAFQVSGATGWHLFRVNEMSGLEMLPHTFAKPR